MSLLIKNKPTVQLFQNEINNLANKYKTSKFIDEIKGVLPEDEFVKSDMIHGIWFYYAIYELPSKDSYTIHAYEDGVLTLEKIIEDKIWLFKNWGYEELFNGYNRFINETLKYKNLRKSWNTESELQSFATYGFESIMKLHNDEKIEIYQKLLALETVSQLDKEDYQRKIQELIKEKQNLEISKIKYKDIYEMVVRLKKEDPRVTENIRKAITEFHGKHADLDKLFIAKNNDLESVVEHLRQLFYQSKYCKL